MATARRFFTGSPVIQPLHWLALALHNDITAELQKLLDAGIIERIDAVSWISNMVVAKKKSGGLRLCVNLRQVYKMVIPEKLGNYTALYHKGIELVHTTRVV